MPAEGIRLVKFTQPLGGALVNPPPELPWERAGRPIRNDTVSFSKYAEMPNGITPDTHLQQPLPV